VKKTLALLILMSFVLVNMAFAVPPVKTGKTGTEKVKVTKVEKTKVKKEVVKGKKTEAPKGVKKAAEKGKGEKKGLLQRWFGGGEKKAPEKGKK